MAQSYSWNDLFTVVGSRFSKGLPASTVATQCCDFISSEMYIEYPWKQTITNTASGKIPLLDSVQDYSAEAPNIMRPVKAWLKRTDVIPFQTIDLDVKKDISVDLYPRSWMAVRNVSLQQSIGLFRLESAVNIPTGQQVELCFDYQANPVKVEGLSQIIWFPDHFAFVAMQGLLYWLYQLGDDARAGSAQTDATGRIVGYTGQLGTYKGALNRMKAGEEYGFTENLFPESAMGLGRDANALNIFANP